MFKQEQPADFVIVPNVVLLHPPIRPRRGGGEGLLAPFQFYVLAGVLIAAREALNQHRHLAALRSGAVAMKPEIKSSKKYFDRRESAEYYGYRPPPKGATIKAAGSGGYKKRRRELSREAIEEIAVDITARQLLRAAGLGLDADNFRAVRGALNRLCEPVGEGDGAMPSPLRAWVVKGGGGLRLLVDGAWVPPGRYARVLWPAPKRSAAALGFWLFAHVIDTRRTNKTEVSAAWFARRLGLDYERDGTGAVNRAIGAAFRAVNAHLADLPDAVVKRLYQGKPRLVPPAGYKCDPATDGKIRIVAIPRENVYDATQAEARPHGRKPSIKRVPSRRDGAGVFASNAPDDAGVFASKNEKVRGSLHGGAGVFASADRQNSQVPQGFSADFHVRYKNDYAREN